MHIHLPERAAFLLGLLAFCLASVMGLSVGVPLAWIGLRGVVAAGIFGLVGYSFGRAIVNIVGEEIFHKATHPPAPNLPKPDDSASTRDETTP